MSYINYSKREVAYKVVLLGAWGRQPPVMEALYHAVSAEGRSRLTAIDVVGAKSLFFDFLPVDIPAVRGFRIRVHVFGWAGKEPGEADIKLLLKGADGVVLFGSLGSSGAFVKSLLEEEKILWLEAGVKDNPAWAVTQLLKGIV